MTELFAIDVGTLLSPEGAEVSPSGRSRVRTGSSYTSDLHGHEPPRGSSKSTAGRHEHTVGVARTLRTAQWTRASLWPS